MFIYYEYTVISMSNHVNTYDDFSVVDDSGTLWSASSPASLSMVQGAPQSAKHEELIDCQIVRAVSETRTISNL